MCASVQAVPLRISGWLFYLQPCPGAGNGGATAPTTLQSTQPKVAYNFAYNATMHATKSRPAQVTLLWWAKPLNTKLRCENKQRVAPLRQSGSRAIFGWPPVRVAFCFMKTEEEASSTIVWSRDQNDGKQAEYQANVRHFELSVTVTETDSSAHAYMVTLFTLSDLGRSCATYLHAFAARSRLITADQIWSPAAHSVTQGAHRAGYMYPFTEVNLPEETVRGVV